LNRVLFTDVLSSYSNTWELVHGWGRIIRSPYFIDVVRMLHIILMGRVSSEVIDEYFIASQYEKRYGVPLSEDVKRVALKEHLIEKSRGVYELTLEGRLFLFVISDLLVEVESFYNTPPTKREITHILRLLSLLRVYEKEGYIAENIGLLTTALSSIKSSARFVGGDEGTEFYAKLVEEYEAIKQLAGENIRDEDFSKALTALASIIDTELAFIKEHLEEIKHLRRKSHLLLYLSTKQVNELRDKMIADPEQYFRFSVVPVSKKIMPVAYIRRYGKYSENAQEIHYEPLPATYEYEDIPIPGGEELFHVILVYFQNDGELPDMADDRWWLSKLSVYADAYKEYHTDGGYMKALRARKVMALSMFLNVAWGDEKLRKMIEKKGREYFYRAYKSALSTHML